MVWVFAVPRLVSVENDALTAGTFISFLLYMTMFAQPIEVIGQMARILNRATSSAYRIFEILDTRPSVKEIKTPEKLGVVKGDVEFKNVVFSYDGVRPILKDMSFSVRQGAPEASMGEVIEAAKVANAHDFIVRLPHGYDTIVGERGHTLSGGERQRVSIARAVLHNPRVLILDEATSAMDTETERKIQEALDRLIEGRTVFAIAHRLSTLRKANRIFVIDDGKISEQGTHRELLEKDGGTYKKLYSMQQEMHDSFAI